MILEQKVLNANLNIEFLELTESDSKKLFVLKLLVDKLRKKLFFAKATLKRYRKKLTEIDRARSKHQKTREHLQHLESTF